MMTVFLRRLCWCVSLLLLQVLLLDRFSLFHLVTPVIIMYFVLILDSDISPAQRMLWGFAMGLISDLFVNTPGVQAASLTLVAYLQPSILRLYASFDRRTKFEPGLALMDFGPYVLYLTTGALLFHVASVLLRVSAGTTFLNIVIRIAAGTLLSVVMMVLVELLMREKRRKSYR